MRPRDSLPLSPCHGLAWSGWTRYVTRVLRKESERRWTQSRVRMERWRAGRKEEAKEGGRVYALIWSDLIWSDLIWSDLIWSDLIWSVLLPLVARLSSSPWPYCAPCSALTPLPLPLYTRAPALISVSISMSISTLLMHFFYSLVCGLDYLCKYRNRRAHTHSHSHK